MLRTPTFIPMLAGALLAAPVAAETLRFGAGKQGHGVNAALAYDNVLATHAAAAAAAGADDGADDEAVRAVATLLSGYPAKIAASQGIQTSLTAEAVSRACDLPYHPAAKAVLAGE